MNHTKANLLYYLNMSCYYATKVFAGAIGGSARYAIKDYSAKNFFNFSTKNLAMGALNNGLYELEDALDLYSKYNYVVPATIETIEISVSQGLNTKNVFIGIGIGTAFTATIDYLYIPALHHIDAILSYPETALSSYTATTLKCATQAMLVILPVIFGANILEGKGIGLSAVIAGKNALGQVITCGIRSAANKTLAEYFLSNTDYYAAQITAKQEIQTKAEGAMQGGAEEGDATVISDFNDESYNDL